MSDNHGLTMAPRATDAVGGQGWRGRKEQTYDFPMARSQVDNLVWMVEKEAGFAKIDSRYGRRCVCQAGVREVRRARRSSSGN